MKFPALHHLTLKAIPTPEGDARAARATFGPDVHPALATLILALHTAIHRPLEIEGEWAPDIDGMIAAFGKASTAALLTGDGSFFDQVRHCLSMATDPQSQADENLAWLAAHTAASVVNYAPPALPPGTVRQWPAQLPPPPASLVMNAMNGFDSKTSLSASTARDACGRKALQLPLATGLRGRKGKPK